MPDEQFDAMISFMLYRISIPSMETWWTTTDVREICQLL